VAGTRTLTLISLHSNMSLKDQLTNDLIL